MIAYLLAVIAITCISLLACGLLCRLRGVRIIIALVLFPGIEKPARIRSADRPTKK